MGKKSLTKSTTKKKTAHSKKSEIAPKTDPKKKQAVAEPGKSAASSKKTKSAPKKKTIPVEKPSIAFLLQKEFGTWFPKAAYAPTPDEKIFTAPSFVDASNAAQMQKLKDLLNKEFDLDAIFNPPKAVPESQVQEKSSSEPVAFQAPCEPVKKEPIPISELLNRNFEAWQPERLFVPAPDTTEPNKFTAPPVIEISDPKEFERIKALLLKSIDLTAPETTDPGADQIVSQPDDQQQTSPETLCPQIPPESKDQAVAPTTDEAPALPPEQATAHPAPEETSTPQAIVERLESPPAFKEPPAPMPMEKIQETKTPSPSQETQKPSIKPESTPAAVKKEIPIPAIQTMTSAGAAPEKHPPASPSIFQTMLEKSQEIFDQGMIILTGCIGLFFAVILLASLINSGRYYLVPSEKGLEIWKGKFSPSGKQWMMTVPDVPFSEPLKKSYTKADALRPAFQHYLKQADELSSVKETPDFEAIKAQLQKAMAVAPTQEDRELALKRLNTIDFTFLMYKADVASRKKTPENIEKALEFLNEAKALDLDQTQQELLEKKINKLKPTSKSSHPSKE